MQDMTLSKTIQFFKEIYHYYYYRQIKDRVMEDLQERNRAKEMLIM